MLFYQPNYTPSHQTKLMEILNPKHEILNDQLWGKKRLTFQNKNMFPNS